MKVRRTTALIVVLACAGCAGGGRYATHWDGRRGYDGNGDYGYDLAASQSEARSYARQASRDYPAPGPADDPWRPYIQSAAQRFKIPARWIREVMRQESSFRQYDSDGSLMTSQVGAMGLMQVMPRTYDTLRQRYGLGPDPYEPRDNILAGAAYIREMYEQYGSPGFLAAYNAGPGRLDSYLNGGNTLPDETVNYVARIAPRLGTEVAMTGPLAVYAGNTSTAAYVPPAGTASRAYAATGLTSPIYMAAVQPAADAQDPADRAFDGGGLVTADAPTGRLPVAAARAQGLASPALPDSSRPPPPAYVSSAPAQQLAANLPPSSLYQPAMPHQPALQMASTSSLVMSPPPGMLRQPVTDATTQTMGKAMPRQSSVPVATPVAGLAARGEWAIQVGAYPDAANSRNAAASARARLPDLLGGTQPVIMAVQRGGVLYRARLAGLSADRASAACARLSAQGTACFTVPPGS